MHWTSSRKAVRFHHSTEGDLILVLVLLALTSIVFLVEPQIDLRFSALFHDGMSFPLAYHTGLQKLRALNDWIAGVLLALSVALLSFASLRKRVGVSGRNALVPILTYGIGVGSLVNATLKETFGRARPRDIIEFGGSEAFTKVWEISDACSSNCSFTSGEAAGAMAMFSAIFILPKFTEGGRLIVGSIMGLVVVILGLNRIAFGAHFLSDVLLSALIVLAVMLGSKLLLDRVSLSRSWFPFTDFRVTRHAAESNANSGV